MIAIIRSKNQIENIKKQNFNFICYKLIKKYLTVAKLNYF